jgi:ABC-2 type transport system permease protein
VPLHDRGYRRREPRGPLRRLRALPIARQTLAQILQRRALVAFLALSFAPFVIGGGAVFLVSRVPDLAAQLPSLAELLARHALWFQMLFAVLITVWAGAGLVGDDLRTGALLVYLSRPLTRADYVLGKLGVLAALNLAVLALPTLALWALAVALEWREPAGRSGLSLSLLPFAILAYSALAAVVLAVLALGASALARHAALAGASLVGAFLLFDAAALVAPPGARVYLRLLSVRADLAAVGDALFGLAPDPAGVHWLGALVALALVSAAALAAVARRVRAVEIVS